MEKARRKKSIPVKIFIGFLIFIFAVIIFSMFFIDNKNIDYENFTINEKTDKSTQVKIAHLSDMHFPKIKVDTNGLLFRLKDEQVDIIAISGDLIDRSADILKCGVIEFIEKLAVIAPVYYVNGNHETDNKDAETLYDYLSINGVRILNNTSVNITIKGANITIIGLTQNTDYNSIYLADNIQAESNYKILLSHRPEKWPAYISDSNSVKPNLVLCGHAHGGQIRIFKQGLLAPNQGLFPKYTSGLFSAENGEVNMIVSRGIGNSLFPFRVNNKPNVPIININI